LLRIPYEEEMKLCDFLVNYLSLQQPNSGAGKSSAPTATTVGPALVPRAANAPEGFTALDRDSHVDMWAPPKKQKDVKPKEPKAAVNNNKDAANPKKKTAEPGSASVRHDLNSIALFGDIGVTPPTTVANIAASIDELKAKKALYASAERGALPSMFESRRAKEDEKMKAREARELRELERLQKEMDSNRATSSAGGASEADGGKKKGGRSSDNKPKAGKKTGAEATGEAAEGEAVTTKEKKPRNKSASKPKPAPVSEVVVGGDGSTVDPVSNDKPKKPRINQRNRDKKPNTDAATDASEGASAASAVVSELVNAAVAQMTLTDADNSTDAPPGL
jgi:hypothetical protein